MGDGGADFLKTIEYGEKLPFEEIKEIAVRSGCLNKCEECGISIEQFGEYIYETTASGGGGCRDIKEALQKAKVIWILEQSIKKNINVNILFKSH